ncbi:bifunctional 2-polyprenyl-6-hydroxyphenol methylase/3-demethylubiquinol 3-O-methyltransferase UbiG [Streptomyces sp. PT12]|uniref:class I SAM-dependent methyltransferase n=1 Tax=Streptomyces sp. PT12 TaxID=1510197 RepID=UPI00215BDE0C|nr:class I SAM-dependent methyltransferase [Streptomyces sp. PT12]
MHAPPEAPWPVRALGRLNAAYPWSHNHHYHRWIMRQVPRRFGRALDVGCGSGELVRLLATRAALARGIDADPRIVEHAREATEDRANVEYAVGDALGDPAAKGPWDVITSVAVLHHLPLTEALEHLKAQLAPGGTLIVVGCHVPATPVDHLLGAVAVPLNPLIGVARNRGRRPGRAPVAMSAPTVPPTMTFHEIAYEARRVLPGAGPRRRVFWRHTLVWRRPDGGAPR